MYTERENRPPTQNLSRSRIDVRNAVTKIGESMCAYHSVNGRLAFLLNVWEQGDGQDKGPERGYRLWKVFC
jgi:hypothetical protein